VSNPAPLSLAVTVSVTLQLVDVVVLFSILLIVGGILSIFSTEIPVKTVLLRALGKITVHDQFSVKTFVKIAPLSVHHESAAPFWSNVTVTVTLPVVHVPLAGSEVIEIMIGLVMFLKQRTECPSARELFIDAFTRLEKLVTK
jgi:hypothetical protein